MVGVALGCPLVCPDRNCCYPKPKKALARPVPRDPPRTPGSRSWFRCRSTAVRAWRVPVMKSEGSELDLVECLGLVHCVRFSREGSNSPLFFITG
jgi:hypothetical protein